MHIHSYKSDLNGGLILRISRGLNLNSLNLCVSILSKYAYWSLVSKRIHKPPKLMKSQVKEKKTLFIHKFHRNFNLEYSWSRLQIDSILSNYSPTLAHMPCNPMPVNPTRSALESKELLFLVCLRTHIKMLTTRGSKF